MTFEEAVALGFFALCLTFFLVVMIILLRYGYETTEAKRRYKLRKLKHPSKK